jgi:hypothetical protein
MLISLQVVLAHCNVSFLTEGDYPRPLWFNHGGLGIDAGDLGLGNTQLPDSRQTAYNKE